MHYPQFPAHFIFGSATAAYQMDGPVVPMEKVHPSGTNSHTQRGRSVSGTAGMWRVMIIIVIVMMSPSCKSLVSTPIGF